MNYFVTGGTGFIGRALIKKLLDRDGTIYVLTREASLGKLEDLRAELGATKKQIISVTGDLSEPLLGVSPSQQKKLKGTIDHFFHLAAIYDLNADAESQEVANIQGTEAAVQLAKAINATCFHQISSIAAAGFYPGVFLENMFDEATEFPNPYLRTKHLSEKVVRESSGVNWRIYRPGMVIGDSKTGKTDKIDGPYYFFKLIQKMRDNLPSWFPMIGIQGGNLNIVPVDYVVDALDHIAHKPDLDGKCFHLTNPKTNSFGEVINIFAEAAHAPKQTMRIDSKMVGFIPSIIRTGIATLPPTKRITRSVLKDLHIPQDALDFVNYPTMFDNRVTERALEDSGISVPELSDYAGTIWDYWDRHLDPAQKAERNLNSCIGGKTVMITGATSGIGKATALKLAETDAQLLLVARTPEKLEETLNEIKAIGGKAQTYRCDISSNDDCDELVKSVLSDHGTVDILVNNAGRSIRRSIDISFDRFHDYERTMQLNYFGSLKLILGFSPKMLEQKSGHIINISSIGVLTNAPRFSAYVASKAALDAFSRCASCEFSDRNVSFTTINMPLVRTPMISATTVYDSVPTLTPDDAADLIIKAIIEKPKRIATRLGHFAQILHHTLPKVGEIVMNTGYTMFPDSAAAQGKKEEKKKEATSEQVAFAAIMNGIHW